MIDRYFKAIGWKTYSGRWDTSEIWFDIAVVTIVVIISSLWAFYVKQ